MLAHPTLDQLNALGLYVLAKGFKELEHKPEVRGLDHAEWLGLLLDCELTLRRQKQFETRASVAELRHSASVEDVDHQNSPTRASAPADARPRSTIRRRFGSRQIACKSRPSRRYCADGSVQRIAFP